MKYLFILFFSFFFFTAGFSQTERLKDRAERSEAYNAVEAERGATATFKKYAARYQEAVKISDVNSQIAIKESLLEAMTQIVQAKKTQSKAAAATNSNTQQSLIKRLKKSDKPTDIKKIIAEFTATL